MSTVGVRELKAQAGEVVRRVWEQGEVIDVTYRGRVVARISPVEPAQTKAEKSAMVWANLEQLAKEIGARMPEGVSAADTMRDVRREL